MKYSLSLITLLLLFTSPSLHAQSDQWEKSMNQCKTIKQKTSQACKISISATTNEAYIEIILKNGKKFKVYESDKENRLNASPASKTQKDDWTCLSQIKNPKTNICYQSK